MRSLARLTRLLPILFIIFFACQPEEEQLLEFDPEMQEVEDILANAEVRYLDFSARVADDMTQCGESKEYPLMWYLSRSVGKVVIYNTPDYLVVEFSLDPGFILKKTELGIKIKNDINGSYDNYVYPVSHDDGIEKFTYKIPLTDFKAVPENLIFKAEISAWKEPGLKPGKLIKALAKDVNLEKKKYLIEYFFEQCDPTSNEYPLMWYLSRSVGKIKISNTPDYLIVEFSLDPGFILKKTELGIQIKNDNNGSYDNYVYPVSHDNGSRKFTYEIPLSDFRVVQDKLLFKAEISAWKEPGLKPGKLIKALAKDVTLTQKKYLIEYFLQNYDPVKEECQVNCQFSFGLPSVDIAKSYSFEDLGITDWGWGYVHEIKHETLFRLPIKQDDSESAAIIGQVTVMIDNDIAYVYYQMNDGYPMNKISIYFSHAKLGSGLPCNYTYERTYTNADGTWLPTLTDTYVIENISEIMANGGDDNKLLYLAAYVDFCE
jgi:hypothetical protein